MERVRNTKQQLKKSIARNKEKATRSIGERLRLPHHETVHLENIRCAATSAPHRSIQPRRASQGGRETVMKMAWRMFVLHALQIRIRSSKNRD